MWTSPLCFKSSFFWQHFHQSLRKCPQTPTVWAKNKLEQSPNWNENMDIKLSLDTRSKSVTGITLMLLPIINNLIRLKTITENPPQPMKAPAALTVTVTDRKWEDLLYT